MPSAPPLRVPLCLRLSLSDGAEHAGVRCLHCGAFHPVIIADGEDVSEPVTCPLHPKSEPLVAVRYREP
jgi:uncharacterized Zn finger protein